MATAIPAWALVIAAVLGGVVAATVVHGVGSRMGRAAPAALHGRLARGLAAPAAGVAFLAIFALALPEVPGRLHGLVFVATVVLLGVLSDRVAGGATVWYLQSVARRTATALDDELAPLFRQGLRAVVIFLGAVVLLAHFRVNVSAFVATAGVASLAFALAAQQTLGNLFAGVSIYLDRPFRVGDRVEVGELVGDVVEVGLRSTRLRTFDNNVVVIPNVDIAASRITNQHYPDPSCALQVSVSVGQHTDIALAKRLLLEVAAACPAVLQSPEPAAYFTGFGEWALDLLLWCYVGDYRQRFAALDVVNEGILRAFRDNGIELPVPRRQLLLQAPAVLTGRGAADGVTRLPEAPPGRP